MSTEDFRASQSQKMKSRRVENDLFRAQKACRQLDMSKGEYSKAHPHFFLKFYRTPHYFRTSKIKGKKYVLTKIKGKNATFDL